MHPPIHFILSAPRSGSTWLTQALNCHPKIFATEQRLFGDFAEIWNNNDGTTSPRITFDSYARNLSGFYFHEALDLTRPEFIDEYIRSYVGFACDFAQRFSGKRVVIDKITPYPGTSKTVIRKIKKLFPESKIIQLCRDGRDVLTSGTFDWLLKDVERTDRHRFFVDGDLPDLHRFFDDGVIDKWAANWRETLEVFNQDRQADLTVRYEAMKQDLGHEVSRIFELLGVEDSAQIRKLCQERTSFQTVTGRSPGNAIPTAKARKGVVGDWQNYFTRHDANRFIDITGRWLTKLGYEPDQSWVESCPEVLRLQNP